MRTLNLNDAAETLRTNVKLAAHLAGELKARRVLPGDDTLETVAGAVEAVSEVAEHFAAIAQEVRYDLPAGYHAPREADGISRPVEAVLIAQQERGVMALVTEALAALAKSASEAATAVYELDHAIARWETAKK